MKKFRNTKAELKKSVPYKKACNTEARFIVKVSNNDR